jgi:SWI/SNF-related matrix-associated actin-dependent regulator 1 of chromatin subfamily A
VKEGDILAASFSTDGPDCVVPVGRELFPFQRGGVHYAIRALLQYRSVLIGDDMGLGKTAQALCVVNQMHIARVLVVCPAFLRINWAREVKTWVTDAEVQVIGYEELVKLDNAFDAPALQQCVIFDECQYLKNHDAKRTKAALALPATWRIFLSGTPIVNRPIELWPVLNAIDPKAWGSRHEFGLQYCAGYPESKAVYVRGERKTITEWNYRGASNLVELQRRLRSTIMVRRLKSAVMKDLPPKIRQIVTFPAHMAGATGELLAQARKIWKAKSEGYGAGSIQALRGAEISLHERIAKVRHEEGLAKVEIVVQHARDVLESVSKVIIFAYHRDVIAKLHYLLSDYNPCVVLGGLRDDQRQEEVDAFQNNDTRRVFIGQIQAAGVGLTLTAAQTVLFAEMDWTPAGMTQAEDRAHRIGQTQSVHVQVLVQDGSLDATIAKVLLRKQKVLDAALDGKVAGEDFSFDPVEVLANIADGDMSA